MQTFKEWVEQTPPPGMDQWVKDNEPAFIANHGEDYKAHLMSAAWTIYRRIYRDPEVMSQ